jgi:hypothetical protein
MKAEDPDALKIWEVKGPRQGGGRLIGVLMQGTGEVVIVHQFASGRYAIYGRRAAVKPAITIAKVEVEGAGATNEQTGGQDFNGSKDAA